MGPTQHRGAAQYRATPNGRWRRLRAPWVKAARTHVQGHASHHTEDSLPSAAAPAPTSMPYSHGHLTPIHRPSDYPTALLWSRLYTLNCERTVPSRLWLMISPWPCHTTGLSPLHNAPAEHSRSGCGCQPPPGIGSRCPAAWYAHHSSRLLPGAPRGTCYSSLYPCLSLLPPCTSPGSLLCVSVLPALYASPQLPLVSVEDPVRFPLSAPLPDPRRPPSPPPSSRLPPRPQPASPPAD
ncbi:unnamed protein product [Dicrocoelium dendriticum]|nr:unnamed protein product [Dicrocoelium dendriticum]